MTEPQPPSLIIETEPAAENVRFLEDQIDQFNVEATGFADGKLFGIFLRDDDGKVIGGAYGWSWGGTCYVRDLFVPAEMRKQGHGRRLMEAIEREARGRGCGQLLLETHEFQAPEFYRKLGFEVKSTIENYPRGFRAFTMVKALSV